MSELRVAVVSEMLDASDRPCLPDWMDKTAAREYETWDSTMCWLFGYTFIPSQLALGVDCAGTRLLDLGCGTGAVARWMAGTFKIEVIGVDSSSAMLDRASTAVDTRVSYHLADGTRMSFLPDASVDVAMACFVFNCIPDAELAQRLMGEVARILRPGGRFCILTPHPDHVHGVRFASFQRGQAGGRYRAGDLIPLHIQRLDGSWTRSANIYWPISSYREWLTRAGFVIAGCMAPVLADLDGPVAARSISSGKWPLERTIAPFLLITGERT
jgi:ubiquinone/menaquinone biosynthesis C-methylase UbiE